MSRQAALLIPAANTVRITEHWHIIKDGDRFERQVYDRHYSARKYADGREPLQFVGPGEKLVLATNDYSAIFAWRFYLDDYLKKPGLWCAVFRNEGPILSSALILEAERVARCRWPKETAFTHVRANSVKSSNPGYCFKSAGWKTFGLSKSTVVLSKNLEVAT